MALESNKKLDMNVENLLDGIERELNKLKNEIEEPVKKVQIKKNEEFSRLEVDFGNYNIFYIQKTDEGTLKFIHKTEGYLGYLDGIGDKDLSLEDDTFKKFENIFSEYGLQLDPNDKKLIIEQINLL